VRGHEGINGNDVNASESKVTEAMLRTSFAHILLFVLGFAPIASVRAQDSSQKKIEFMKYPVAGSDDATGEIQTPEDRELLDDFYRSKVQEQLHQAAITNDADKFDSLLAPRMTWIAERFGKGVTLTKAQVLDDLRSGNLHVNTQSHSHVRLVVIGNSTVAVTGISYSKLIYQGKISEGPRMFAEVWVRLGSTWQMVAHHVSDVAKM